MNVFDAYAHLYVGDYIADTMHFSAAEHCVLRQFLLELWVRGRIARGKIAVITAITGLERENLKRTVMPLVSTVRPAIMQRVRVLRAARGHRLPSAEWGIIRQIIFERDGYVCTYCGSTKQLQGDHVVPLSRGGSNAFANLTTACRACNQAKSRKRMQEWTGRAMV